MKLVALIITLLSISYAFEDKCRGAYLKSVHKKCMLENGGNEELITKFLQFKETDDADSKCFLACLMRECKYFNDDGKLNPDVPKRLSRVVHGDNESNAKLIEGVAAKCVVSQTYGDSSCDNAAEFASCVIQKTPVSLKLSKIYD